MDKVYKIEQSPPPAMLWSEYEAIVRKDWNSLLASEEGKVESNIQKFLETHPSLVPGAQSMSGASGHSAFPCALISQPKLAGFESKIPDFMWLAADSMTIYAVVIEIEAPDKKWFRKNGDQTADFTQARSQLTDWKIWFDDSNNRTKFLDYYCPDAPLRQLLPQYVLIYGRRSEFESNPNFAQKRLHLQNSNETFMSFDRLSPSSNSDQYLCVKRKKDGYLAVSVPPTIKLGPLDARYRAQISGKKEALEKNLLVTHERKKFLQRRFNYWDELSRKGGLGIFNTGDSE